MDGVLLQLGTKLMLGVWVRRVAGIVAIIVATLAGLKLKLDRFYTRNFISRFKLKTKLFNVIYNVVFMSQLTS